MNSATHREEVDHDVIVLDDSHQIDVWCERLACSAADLANAIGDVGFSAASVRQRLVELKSQRRQERQES
jgi:hypothetical protein